jgi:hypothetical protein
MRLNKGRFSVISAETKTGIILTLDGKRHLGKQDDFHSVFNSIAEAESFAKNKVNTNPDIECSIRDESGEQIKLIKK